jgi:hypothetical protein
MGFFVFNSNNDSAKNVYDLHMGEGSTGKG